MFCVSDRQRERKSRRRSKDMREESGYVFVGACSSKERCSITD